MSQKVHQSILRPVLSNKRRERKTRFYVISHFSQKSVLFVQRSNTGFSQFRKERVRNCEKDNDK